MHIEGPQIYQMNHQIDNFQNLCDNQRFCFFKCFFYMFLYEITLTAIDIDNIGCLEPFLPL